MYFCAFVVVLHHQLYSLIFNYFLNERNLESTMNVKDYVVQELESYPRTLRQIAVLRYELEHPVQVSTEEMLDAMAFARGEHFGVAPGHVSDKTLYIAMNYRQKANEVNAEISGEISAKLLELEHKKNRIEYYVGMLDSRKAEIIRLCFFKGMTIEEAAEKLDVSAKTAQNAKKKALEDLTELFALTLYCGANRLDSWDGSGKGTISLSGTCRVETGKQYKLTLTYSINGNTKPPVTVTSKCN